MIKQRFKMKQFILGYVEGELPEEREQAVSMPQYKHVTTCGRFLSQVV